VKQTFEQAKEARMQILDVIEKTIPEPRAELSPYAPRIITLRIDPEMIGNVIGPGGKTINEMIEQTGVQAIDIEDDGLVMITSTDADGAEKAKTRIEELTKVAKVGEIYKGKVTRIMDFGAIVEFLPKRDGMVHVSMMAPWRVENVSDIVKMGQEVFVKIMEISPDGKTSLSMKDAPGNVYPEKPKHTPRPEEGNNRRRPAHRHSSPSPSGNRRPPQAPRPPQKNN
jgi:polyribonucleotide nucleotidyltransferase